MNFTFENQGTHTYLVYTIAEDDAIDSMSLGMIINNRIHGLAHSLFTQMDATKYIKYDVSAKISVKQFFSGPVNKKRLIGVFNGIVDAILAAEDYMIDVNSIMLDLDFIFADVSTCETSMICLPVISDDLRCADLGMFFKNIMFTTQFDQTENCDHVAKLINYLNSTPVFSLVDFKKLLEEIDGVSAPAPQPVAPPPTGLFNHQPQPAQAPAYAQPVQPKPQPQAQPAPQPAQTPVYAKPIQPKPQPQAQPAPQQPQPQVQIPQAQQARPAQPQVQIPKAQQNGAQAQAQPADSGEKMSWFYLMQHYNKENAAKYKAQKDAKKNAQPAPAMATPAPQGRVQPQQNGFAIPGQQTPVNQAPAYAQPARPAQAPVYAQPAPHQPKPQPQAQPAPQPAKPMNFGETTVLGGGGNVGETTVLGAAPQTQITPHLIRTKNNEKINLNKPVFRIGKEKSYVDYFIGDNSAVSRSHANIISRDGEYLVVDTNSTNHTYVNGQMIQSNVETKITHGTKIRLANEDFEFKLY